MRIGNANTTAVGVDSVAVGTPASASAGNGIAIGRNTTVMNNTFGLSLNSTIAIGSKSTASPSGVAIGDQISAGAGGKVEPGYGVAVGFQSNSADERANAVGAQTNALGAGSTAVGRFGNARGEDSIVLVRQTTASGKNGIGIGFFPTAEDAYAVGLNARAQAVGSIAIGSGSIVGASANANDANEAVAIGKGAKALHAWLATQGSKVVDGGATAEAIDYSLKCCTALMRRFDDPALPIDNKSRRAANQNRLRQRAQPRVFAAPLFIFHAVCSASCPLAQRPRICAITLKCSAGDLHCRLTSVKHVARNPGRFTARTRIVKRTVGAFDGRQLRNVKSRLISNFIDLLSPKSEISREFQSSPISHRGSV
jgi:hypothetical protein